MCWWLDVCFHHKLQGTSMGAGSTILGVNGFISNIFTVR